MRPDTILRWQHALLAHRRSRPGPGASTWAPFLRSQTQALLATDFIETFTRTGARLSIPAVIEHASRRVRVLRATTAWVTEFIPGMRTRCVRHSDGSPDAGGGHGGTVEITV
jgi:hypothetical protein